MHCPICSVVFVRNGSVKIHIETAHVKKNLFKCPKCEVAHGEKLSEMSFKGVDSTREERVVY